jgi:hypothetical protein
MMFIAFVLFAAFLLEGLGTWISVLGLSALFAGSPIVIAMAVSLDIAKVAGVTFLYKNWKEISLTMKAYMSLATFVLMMITSAGVFGYLSGEFQKAISGNNQQTVLIDSLTEEKARLQKRKEEIDAQIANLPSNAVTSRVRLTNQFKEEATAINQRLVAIDKDLPQLKITTISQNTKIGPIMYVAQVFNTTPEQAVKWVIMVIIFVFDPLAVALLVAGNFLLAQRKADRKEVVAQPEVLVNEQPNKPSVIPQISPWKFTIAVPQVKKAATTEPKVVKKPAKKRVYRKAQKPVTIAEAVEPVQVPAEEVVEQIAETTKETDSPEIITLKSLKSGVFKSSLDGNDYPIGQISYPDIPVRHVPQPVLPKTSLDEIDPQTGDIEFTKDTSTGLIKEYKRT